MSNSTITIKFNQKGQEDDLRRVSMALRDALFERVQNHTAAAFNLDPSTLLITYKDSEGDTIRVASQQDFDEALVCDGLDTPRGKVIRLVVDGTVTDSKKPEETDGTLPDGAEAPAPAPAPAPAAAPAATFPWATVGDKSSLYTNRKGQPSGDLGHVKLADSKKPEEEQIVLDRSCSLVFRHGTIPLQRIVSKGDGIYFLTGTNGNTLQVSNAKGHTNFANKNQGAWERWILETKGDQMFFVSDNPHCRGNTLGVSPGGAHRACNKNRLGHEAFKIVYDADMKAADTKPGDFDRLLHIPSGVTIDVEGQTLPHGRVCFKLVGDQKNIAIGPKGCVSNNGGQGPWAQFSLVAGSTAETYHLESHGNAQKGWTLDLDVSATCTSLHHKPVFMRTSRDSSIAPWQFFIRDTPFTPVAPAAWYTKKLAAKKAEKEAVEEQTRSAAPVSSQLTTISLAGNRDGRQVSVGSHLSIHESLEKDVFDANGTWAMVTAKSDATTLWRMERGGWVPDGLVSLEVAGNVDGRTTAQHWSLMVSHDSKAPHKRDGSSAYLIATRTMGKKGGLWAVEACREDPTKCVLRYAGNRDGRKVAEGYYLAVHASRKGDHRDADSNYAIVTKDARKASLFDIRPYWGEVPPPPQPPKQLELDAAGNPKIGFHTAKKSAVKSLRGAVAALGKPAAPPTSPLSAREAAAAITSLRVGMEWLRKKSGLPIHIEEISNEEALDVVNKLRELPGSWPKWAAKEVAMPEDAPHRVDAFVMALAEPLLALWDAELGEEGAPAKPSPPPQIPSLDLSKKESPRNPPPYPVAPYGEFDETLPTCFNSTPAPPKPEESLSTSCPGRFEPAVVAPAEEEVVSPGSAEPDLLTQLSNMGFSSSAAKHALENTGGDLGAAVDILLTSEYDAVVEDVAKAE